MTSPAPKPVGTTGSAAYKAALARRWPADAPRLHLQVDAGQQSPPCLLGDRVRRRVCVDYPVAIDDGAGYDDIGRFFAAVRRNQTLQIVNRGGSAVSAAANLAGT